VCFYPCCIKIKRALFFKAENDETIYNQPNTVSTIHNVPLHLTHISLHSYNCLYLKQPEGAKYIHNIYISYHFIDDISSGCIHPDLVADREIKTEIHLSHVSV